MEKVMDFFKDLKERISSPLISSFIISWLCFNWKLIISLFKYDSSKNTLEEFKVFLQFLSSEINRDKSFLYPLGIAIFYTIIYPFIRNGIQILDAWFKAWGNQFKLRASKSNMVSIEKYVNLREIYKKRSDILQSVLEEESKTIQRNELLVNENSELKNRINQKDSELALQNEQLLLLQNEKVKIGSTINSLEIQLSKLNLLKSNEENRLLVESLNGFWLVSRNLKNDSELILPNEKIRIQNGKVFKLDDIGIESYYYMITEYQYRPESNNIFIKTNRSSRDQNMTFSLIPTDDFNILTGKESHNPVSIVTFRKVSTLEELKSL